MSEQTSPAVRPSAFRRGILLTGSGTATTLVSLFLETIVVVRLLSTELFGIYVILTTMVTFLVIAVDLGVATAATRLIASSDRERQVAVANSALIFRLLMLVALSATIWLATDLLGRLEADIARYVGYIPLMLVPASFDDLLLSILQGFQVYRHMAAAQILRSVLRLSLTVGLLVVGKLGLLALVYSWAISFTLSVIYQFLVLPVAKRFVCQRALLGELLRFGFPLYMTSFLWFGVKRVNVLLLATLGGPASVASYAVAIRIPEALQRLADSYIAVYFPTLVALLSAGNRKQASWMLNCSLRLISFATALLAIVVVVFSPQIITLLFDEKYATSSWAFALLMIAFHITFTMNLMGYTLTAAGFSGRSFVASLVHALVNVFGNLLLIRLLGFTGSAYAGLIAVYTASVVAILLLRHSGLALKAIAHIKQTLLLLLCAGLFWWSQPDQLAYKIGIIALFVLLTGVLAPIRWDDVAPVLPKGLIRRLDSVGILASRVKGEI